MEKQLNILVVGAGISGATAARGLKDFGHKVTVIDQADHVGGNCYDFQHQFTGSLQQVLVQKFGPHIFHTNSEKVFNFLSRYTDWVPYTHRVRANLGASCSIGMTINAKTLIDDLIDDFLDLRLTESEAKNLLANIALELGSTEVSIGKLLSATSVEAKLIGSVLWKKIYEPYTLYQWGTTSIDESVFDRVLIRLDGSDVEPSYFKDKWQVMPALGFTWMIQSILRGIDVHLNTAFTPAMVKDYDHVFCTASIDDVLRPWNLKDLNTPLPYRTMYASIAEDPDGSFALKFRDNASYNDASAYFSKPCPVTINGSVKMLKAPIRFTSFRKLANEDVDRHEPDVYCQEYPMPWEDGLPRHYPIPTRAARDLYNQYAALAESIMPTVTFFGRLGSYQYLNVDQAAAQAMAVVNRFLGNSNADL